MTSQIFATVRVRVSLALMSLLLAGAGLPAQAQEVNVFDDNANIQVRHIMVTAYKSNGKPEIRPVTPLMTVPDGGDVPFVCQYAPKVNDAIVTYFFDYPPKIARNNKFMLDQHAPKLAAYVNRALGKVMVSNVYLVEGGRKMVSGAAANLPGGRLGCGKVLDEYERHIQSLQEASK